MSISRNPFLERTSERLGEQPRFVHTFAASAISLLPEDPWGPLVVFRSSPGAGKTSLMRLFDADTLTWIASHNPDPLRDRLADLGCLDTASRRPLRVGVRIDLRTGYKTILDAAAEPRTQEGLFRRLLDVRVLGAAIRAYLRSVGLTFPQDAVQLSFLPVEEDAELDALIGLVGGANGADILERARAAEGQLLEMTDRLPGSKPSEATSYSRFVALDLLDRTQVVIAGQQITAVPHVMFDDGQDLPPVFRDLLIADLRRRYSRLSRWYAERHSALEPGELLGDGEIIGRDVHVVDLDRMARSKQSRHPAILREMATLRASESLRDAQEHRTFFELLDPHPRDLKPYGRAVEVLAAAVSVVAEGNDRYLEPLADAQALAPVEAVERLRTLQIAVYRDLDKQQSLFGDALSEEEAELTSSLREAASTLAANEHGLPFYAGADRVLKLASGNADQFMMLCGELFNDMQVSVSVGRDPRLSFERQHQIVRSVARRFWESIPQVVPAGRVVQRLVEQFAAMARAEDNKPKVPYPPGVTGFSVWASSIDRLKSSRAAVDRDLLALLANSVAHNVFSLDTERRSKDHRVYVFYLNRLLCPLFQLSLGYGGHREQKPELLRRWAGLTGQDPLL